MVGQRDGVRNPRLRLGSLLVVVLIVGLVILTGWWLFSPEADRGPSIASQAVSSDGIVIKTTPGSGSHAREEGIGESSETNINNHGDPSKHPLDPVLEIARRSLEKIRTEVVDYRARMVKRERVNGRLGDESEMSIKVMKPKVVESANGADGASKQSVLHVYLRFENPSSVKGREVIWIEGRNDNKMIAHETGLLNLLRTELAPDGTLAMMGNKYPITEIGLENLVRKLIEKGERDRQIGDCQVLMESGHRVGDRECQLIQVTHPEKKDGYDFHVAQIFMDVERTIPLRYAAYLWPSDGGEPPLEEEYTYLDLELNVGLTDEDFNPDNPNYKFP